MCVALLAESDQLHLYSHLSIPHGPMPRSKLETTRAFLAKGRQAKWMPKAMEHRFTNRAKAKSRVTPYLHKPTPGIPPAPVHLYGSDNLVSHHAYQWDPTTTMGAHFRPERHSVVINGRLMQARSARTTDSGG